MKWNESIDENNQRKEYEWENVYIWMSVCVCVCVCVWVPRSLSHSCCASSSFLVSSSRIRFVRSSISRLCASINPFLIDILFQFSQ
jgi:hypothetical protein